MVLAALEAGPCPFPPPKSGCLLAALSSSRAVLRVRDRTSSSCLRSAWTESNSMWRAWIFSELLQNQKDQNKMVFLKKRKKKGQKKKLCRNPECHKTCVEFPYLSLLWMWVRFWYNLFSALKASFSLLYSDTSCSSTCWITVAGRVKKGVKWLFPVYMSKHCLSDSKWSNNHTLWSVLSFVASPDCWWAKDERRAEISFCRKRTKRCDLKIKKHEILVHQLKSFTDTWASASFFSTSCMSSFRALISASLSLENGCMASSWAFISSWQCDKVACEHQVYRIYRKTNSQGKMSAQVPW